MLSSRRAQCKGAGAKCAKESGSAVTYDSLSPSLTFERLMHCLQQQPSTS